MSEEQRQDGYWIYQVTKVRNSKLAQEMKVLKTWVEVALAGPFTERESAEARLLALAWRTPVQFKLEIRYGLGPHSQSERDVARRGMAHASRKTAENGPQIG